MIDFNDKKNWDLFKVFSYLSRHILEGRTMWVIHSINVWIFYNTRRLYLKLYSAYFVIVESNNIYLFRYLDKLRTNWYTFYLDNFNDIT